MGHYDEEWWKLELVNMCENATYKSSEATSAKPDHVIGICVLAKY